MRAPLFVAIVISPLAALVACSASNGEGITPDVREAGTIDAGTGKDKKDSSDPTEDGSKPDGAKDSGKDVADSGDESDASEAGSSAVVHINEIYVDIDGFGDGAEYVELRAAPGSRVDDLTIRVLNGAGTLDHVVAVADPGDQVGATGFWVVGGAQTFKLGVTDRVDHVISISGWGLKTSRGAVQLLRGTQLLDVVSWSEQPDAGAIPAPPSPPVTTGEGSPASVPTITKTASKPAHSFGRQANAADTNDNLADFCSMVASPGHDQAACD